MNILRTATLVAVFIKCVAASTDSIPSQGDLVIAVSRPESMCSPDDLFNLLGKIEKQEDQKRAIQDGVMHLFPERTECLDPLLDALEGNASLKYLKDVVIKQAFGWGSAWRNKSIVERFHDHAAVTSKDYAWGLINSENNSSTQDPVFIFLLGEADQDDLNAVKENWSYEDASDEFKEAIENALLIAKPGETRRTLPFQRAELAMKTFQKNLSMRIPTVISQLIGRLLFS